MAERPDRAALRAELLALIGEAAPDLDGTLGDDTPLITSGIVESTALLELARGWTSAWASRSTSPPSTWSPEWDTPRRSWTSSSGAGDA